MKKRFVFLLTALMLCLVFVFSACGEGGTTGDNTGSDNNDSNNSSDSSDGNESNDDDSNVLVAYFSATGTTKGVAEKVAVATGGTLYEILPETPYTQADLNYNSDCRANREQNDPAARPAIDGGVDHMETYDVIYLGYPIWWSKAPKIIYTFLESYEFAGKTIVPFCTSGSSPIGGSLSDMQAIASDATWLSGKRFAGGATQADVTAWVNGVK